MADRGFLAWPFFEPRHRALADEIERLVRGHIRSTRTATSTTNAGSWCARWARPACSNFASPTAIAGPTCAASQSSAKPSPTTRGLADFAFAMQGLGSGAICCSGRSSRSANGCPRSRAARRSPPSRMTEPECGSDAANIATSAMRDGNEWVLVGEKTYISNGGIADFYVTFARTGEGEGARGLSAFIVARRRRA